MFVLGDGDLDVGQFVLFPKRTFVQNPEESLQITSEVFRRRATLKHVLPAMSATCADCTQPMDVKMKPTWQKVHFPECPNLKQE